MSSSIVASYKARGIRLVFYEVRTKGPQGPEAVNWTARDDQPEHYRDGMNVGIFTGTEIASGRFLLDVDFDWTDGLPMVKALLPVTHFGFGRASKVLSHAFYTSSSPQPSRAYKNIGGVPTFVELRGTTSAGSVGMQTMAPPSEHPNGERIELKMDGAIAHDDAVPRRVLLYAVACCLVFHLGPRGFVHDSRLAVAGFLLEEGLTEHEVIAIGEAVASIAGNDVADVAPAVGSTVAKMRDGARRRGAGALSKALGENGKKVVTLLRGWIRGTEHDGVDGVEMVGGRLSEIVDRAEAALLPGAGIYQRGGVLVRNVTVDKALGESGRDPVRRAAGSSMLVAVREAWLLEMMGRALPWSRLTVKGDRVPADPAPIYARTLLSRGEWRFPVLRGVVTAPTLAADGRVIAEPGFDHASGLLLDFAREAFPPVPVNPSEDDARAALKRLLHPLRAFPFVDDAARSVALSAMLTALVRLSLRTAPLHGFDAPAPGTGKSLLAELAGLLATGARPPALSQGKTAEEDEKRLSTVLFAGDPVIHIDNCERPIAGDFLCSMLTQAVVQARVLGLSERRILPSTALVLASGNNLAFAGDTSRRAVIARLDAEMERPDTRSFDFDCHAEVIADRPQLVVDGLTVLRAFDVAGRPGRLEPMGSFEDWAWIRGALAWLGCADPSATRSSILDADPRKDELVGVLDVWYRVFGYRRVEVGEIGHDERAADLCQQLIEVACRNGVWNGKSVGWWLRRHKDRVVGGRCLRAEPGADGARWWLAGEAGEAAPGAGTRLPFREGDDL